MSAAASSKATKQLDQKKEERRKRLAEQFAGGGKAKAARVQRDNEPWWFCYCPDPDECGKWKPHYGQTGERGDAVHACVAHRLSGVHLEGRELAAGKLKPAEEKEPGSLI